MSIPILPYPKEYFEKEGFFDFKSASVNVTDGLDERIIKAAIKLRRKLSEKTNSFHKFARTVNKIGNAIMISKDVNLRSEEYTIEITDKNAFIIGGDDAGCFYGIGTFMQLLDNSEKTRIPALIIKDSPDMNCRGFYHDATRGRVPSVEGMKSMIDVLAKLKINSLQLYIEHTFDFDEFNSTVRTEDEYLTAEDILLIDDYCYENFIDFVPSLSTFGHLYELLMKKEYSYLCELDDFKPENHFWRERMFHHTIDPTNPKSFEVVCSLIDQYLPLFRSKYFNICCDETFDLGTGKNKDKNKAKLYIDFVSEIAQHIKNAGKTAMMWGDIALEHPELLPQIPESTILLNWWYDENPDPQRIIKVKEQGKPQIVCPGTNSWYALIEKPSVSVPNITKMIKNGFYNGALGVLNTNWGDYGHPAHFECTLFGTTLGACVSWNISTDINAEFEKTVSNVVYGTGNNIVPIIRELGDIQLCSSWLEFFEWQKSRNPSVFKSDNNTIKSALNKCGEICDELARIEDNNGFLKPILVAAKGIYLLNSAALEIKNNGSVNTEWKCNICHWFDEYKKCWIKGSKQSEMKEIQLFLNNM